MSEHHQFAVGFVRHFRHDNLDRDIYIRYFEGNRLLAAGAGGGRGIYTRDPSRAKPMDQMIPSWLVLVDILGWNLGRVSEHDVDRGVRIVDRKGKTGVRVEWRRR